MKTALVTGAAGFIGSHIAEALVSQGWRVICIDNMKTGKYENLQPWFNRNTCELHVADVSEYSAIVQYFPGVDVVFHNAASKCTVCREDPKTDLLVNALGTMNVCHAAIENGVKKVIHASTGSVNDIRSYYGNSKNAGEGYVGLLKNYYPQFNFTTLRYHHVYGPRQDDSDKGGVIPIFIRNIHHGNPVTIFGDGLQVRHFTHVSDIVRANLWAAENPVTDGKTYNVLSDVTCTINELASDLMRLMGRDVPTVYAPAKQGDIRTFTATAEEIKADGFVFRENFNDGLKDTIQWYCRKWERKAA